MADKIETREGEPAAARAKFRTGLAVPTSGWASGFTQANLISVPREHAYDALLFMTRNPQACPLLDVTDAGSTSTSLGAGIDLRVDLPGYRIYEDGQWVDEVSNVANLWRDDLVTFLLGCSFTFEDALVQAGVPIRHLEASQNVPMYRTSISTNSAGRMRGPLVVSMRAVPAHLVTLAVEITARYPTMHGAPVHVGEPEAIGITDLSTPHFGDAPIVLDGDVPMFWACGVTPQAALEQARFPFALTHAPGQMLITDVRNEEWAT